LFDFLSEATELEVKILAVSFWHIWEARNNVWNNQAQLDLNRIAAKIRTYIDTIVQHCNKPHRVTNVSNCTKEVVSAAAKKGYD
jgi:hypothetical protein